MAFIRQNAIKIWKKERRVKRSLCLIMAVSLSLLILSACQPVVSESTITLGPTVISTAPSTQQTTVQPTTSQRTTRPTEPVRELLSPADYGTFSSGHTLQLPAGVWFDSSEVSTLNKVTDLVVTSSGQGKPTLSSSDEGKPLLSLQGCANITFRQIRFGFDRPDWTGRQVPDFSTLVEVRDSNSILFEDCEFFGSAGSAILLNSSENIVLRNCTFYNHAGQPLKTGDAYLPSQLRVSDSLFETVDSGPLVLHVRDSSFDRCVWIGRKGYRVPVASDGQQTGFMPLDLTQLLRRVLAGRIDYFSDERKNLTVRDNLFTSDEVFALFEQMEQTLPALLPANAIAWSLSGQKSEEAPQGSALDPTLGLNLSLRVKVDTPDSAANSSSPQQTPAPQLPAPLYDIQRLLADLQDLIRIEGKLDPLLTGNLFLKLSDQNQNQLLSLALPLDELDRWLDISRPDFLLEHGQIVLYNQDLIPADFCQRDNAGSFAAAHILPVLRPAFDILSSPLVLNRDDQIFYLENDLFYQGTQVAGGVAEHQFLHQLTWTSAEGQLSDAGNTRQIRTLIAISADAMNKTMISTEGDRLAFQLADQELADQIRQLLQQGTWTTEQDDGSILYLQTVSTWTMEQTDCLPLFLIDQKQDLIDLRTVLYDLQCRPVLVNVSLIREEESWTVHSVSPLNGA